MGIGSHYIALKLKQFYDLGFVISMFGAILKKEKQEVRVCTFVGSGKSW